MKEREVKIITYGSIDIEQMSEAEQRAFYATFYSGGEAIFRPRFRNGKGRLRLRISKGMCIPSIFGSKHPLKNTANP